MSKTHRTNSWIRSRLDKSWNSCENRAKRGRNALQSVTLLETIENEKLDACGGGRRDEEKARQRSDFSLIEMHSGNGIRKPTPRASIIQCRKIRKTLSFPCNWTEMDVWQYAKLEEIELPNLYFAHQREVFLRNGSLLAVTDFIQTEEKDVSSKTVRFERSEMQHALVQSSPLHNRSMKSLVK